MRHRRQAGFVIVPLTTANRVAMTDDAAERNGPGHALRPVPFLVFDHAAPVEHPGAIGEVLQRCCASRSQGPVERGFVTCLPATDLAEDGKRALAQIASGASARPTVLLLPPYERQDGQQVEGDLAAVVARPGAWIAAVYIAHGGCRRRRGSSHFHRSSWYSAKCGVPVRRRHPATEVLRACSSGVDFGRRMELHGYYNDGFRSNIAAYIRRPTGRQTWQKPTIKGSNSNGGA